MDKKFTSDEIPLSQLLNQAASGELQLPDFQRSWVWDDSHIRSLLASVSLSYPIGAVMTLQTGNPDVRFRSRYLEGADSSTQVEAGVLLLDGQQRMTSLFMSLKSKDAVPTRDSRGKELKRHYYADLKACTNLVDDREEEGIIGVPADRVVTTDFGREVVLDLSSRASEIEAEMFPLDIVLDASETMDWQMQYLQDGPGEAIDRFRTLEALSEIHHHALPPVSSPDDPTRSFHPQGSCLSGV